MIIHGLASLPALPPAYVRGRIVLRFPAALQAAQEEEVRAMLRQRDLSTVGALGEEQRLITMLFGAAPPRPAARLFAFPWNAAARDAGAMFDGMRELEHWHGLEEAWLILQPGAVDTSRLHLDGTIRWRLPPPTSTQLPFDVTGRPDASESSRNVGMRIVFASPLADGSAQVVHRVAELWREAYSDPDLLSALGVPRGEAPPAEATPIAYGRGGCEVEDGSDTAVLWMEDVKPPGAPGELLDHLAWIAGAIHAVLPLRTARFVATDDARAPAGTSARQPKARKPARVEAAKPAATSAHRTGTFAGGVDGVRAVIQRVRQHGFGLLGEHTYWRQLDNVKAQPVPERALARATLPGGRALPATWREWLAFDGAWLKELGWFESLDPLVFRPRPLWEVVDEDVPAASRADDFRVPRFADCFLLAGGSDSRRVLVLSDSPDSAGEHPVFYIDADHVPSLGALHAGLDVYLGWAAGCIEELDRENRTYTDIAMMEPFKARNAHHVEHLLDGEWDIEFPAIALAQPLRVAPESKKRAPSNGRSKKGSKTRRKS